MAFRSTIAASLLGAAALVSGSASAAIVVASSGPSASQFPAGKKLDDASRITLQKGDSVTVLDKRGTKVLRGPGRFAVSQPGRAQPNQAFSILTRNQAATRARTGAVRGTPPLSPNLWFVDVAKPGTQCITDPATIRFWRADDKKAARYRISSPSGGSETLAFAAGTATVPWDRSKTPLSDGAAFTLAKEGDAARGPLTFVIVQNPPPNAEALASVLIEKGCSTQLELLSTTLAISRF